MCHTETPSSMTAPFGFYPAHSPCLMGTPKSQGNDVHAGSVRAGFWGPLGPAVPAGKTRRAAHKDVAVSGGAGSVLRKFLLGLRTCAKHRRVVGWPSFVYFDQPFGLLKSASLPFKEK